MTPSDFSAFLAAARSAKVAAFEVGELKVTFHPLALIDELPVALTAQSDKATVTDPPASWRGVPLERLFPDA